MTAHRGTIVLLVSSALLGVLAAQAGAKPEPAGISVVTCKKKTSPGGAGFSKAHCKAADKVGTGAEYEHQLTPVHTQTELGVSNLDTSGKSQVAKLVSTANGSPFELQAGEVATSGVIENATTPKGESSVKPSLVVLTFSKAAVAIPEKEECKIKGEQVVTKSLTPTINAESVTLKPATGTVLATFVVEGCKIAAINGSYELTGEVACSQDGATLSCTLAATTEQELNLNGKNAGFESSVTIQAKDAARGDASYTPLSLTSGAGGFGTTAFTCQKQEGGSGFSKAHCKAEDAVATGAEYQQVSIAEETTTEVLGASSNTAGESQITKLKSTIAGISLEIQAAEAITTGSLENLLNTATDHLIYGEATIHYGGVKVTAPAGKGCKVKGEEITTNTLVLSTAGAGMAARVEPLSEVFATVTVEGCSIAGLNNSYQLKGFATCPVDGATIICSEKEMTEQVGLKMLGQKVGIEGSTTVSGRAKGGTIYTPVSFATVETP